MGRPRSNFICPKCGKLGYIEKNPTRNPPIKGRYRTSEYRKYWRVVHYDSFTHKRHRCYVNNKMAQVEARFSYVKNGIYDLKVGYSVVPLKWKYSILKDEMVIELDITRARKILRDRE